MLTAAGTTICSRRKYPKSIPQAQRRFRERQKSLIGDLQDQVGGLQTDLAMQANQVFLLQVAPPPSYPNFPPLKRARPAVTTRMERLHDSDEDE